MSTLRDHWYRVRMIERTNEDAPGMASGEQTVHKVLAKNKKEAELRFTRAGDNVLSVEDVGSDLHVQAAKALGWTVTQAQSMSMLVLREAVRLVDPALADDMSAEMPERSAHHGQEAELWEAWHHQGRHVLGRPAADRGGVGEL